MTKKGISTFENGLIWFGAAVSLAEIQSGTAFASLGFRKGLFANFLGHIIGCVLLFLTGLIGARTRRSAMESVKTSFGKKGGMLFSGLNVVQLVGWTAIMIYDGAFAAEAIFSMDSRIWCVVIGGLIVLWILAGIQNLGKFNTAAMAALFVLTIVMSFALFGKGTAFSDTQTMSFGAAVELSAAMPISWLPLIGDYTREAEKPVRATAVSAGVYGIVSCWMYTIGMGAAMFAGGTELAQIMLKTGLGIAGLIVVVFSTVTTTFLDAWSAGLSCEALCAKCRGKYAAVVTTILGTVCAMLFPMTDITDFLYLIGSVFAPMTAILIADFFILKRDNAVKLFDVRNFVIWLIGFIAYRVLMRVDIPVGNTFPDMLLTIFLCVIAERIFSNALFNTRKS